MSRTVRVGLLWHSIKSGNLGVGALTVAHIDTLRSISKELGIDLKFEVIGWADSGEPYIADVAVTELRMKDFLPLVGGLSQAVRRCDVIFDIGAGDSFADTYGAKRLFTQMASKFIVLAHRRPLVLAPQTIGPFEGRSAKILARWVLGRARLVFSRDELTTHFASSLQPSADVIEVTDLAMALPIDPSIELPSSTKTRVGLNVSGLLMAGGYSGDNMFGLTVDYRETMRRLIREIAADETFEVHLVSHVADAAASSEDDYKACLELNSEFPMTVVVPPFGSPSAAKGYISQLDAFMGARMHACIAAFSAGVPVLPIAYSRKFAGLFGTLGYGRLLDLRSSTQDEAIETVTRFLDSLEAARSEVAAARVRVDDRLADYRDPVRQLLFETSRSV